MSPRPHLGAPSGGGPSSATLSTTAAVNTSAGPTGSSAGSGSSSSSSHHAGGLGWTPRAAGAGPTASMVGGSSSRGHRPQAASKRIIIRPYSKPPTLPPNYYAETVTPLLQGTLTLLQAKAAGSSSAASNVTSHTPSDGKTHHLADSSSVLSLQNAYTAVVHLVSHQYGPRLYQDLVLTMQQAAVLVLPVGDASSSHRDRLLSWLPRQYQLYTDFILLCKHVFLPLDRTHAWHAVAERAVPLQQQQPPSTQAAASTSSSSSSSPPPPTQEATLSLSQNKKSSGGGGEVKGPPVVITTTVRTPKTAPAGGSQPYLSPGSGGGGRLQSIWQVGLVQFHKRLQELQWDQALYQEWLQALLVDWNPVGTMAGMSEQKKTSMDHATTHPLLQRQDLQAVWYMWQDLGLLHTLPLQSDLEQYWHRQGLFMRSSSSSTVSASAAANLPSSSLEPEKSTATETSTGFQAAAFLQFAFEKHAHVTAWPWLPTAWLWQILDLHLVQPHLNANYLLHPQHLFPLLEQQVFQATAMSVGAPGGATSNRFTGDASSLLSSPSMVGRSNSNVATTSNTAQSIHRVSSVQQLWMLAGRLPGGQQGVAKAVASFARVQGLQRVQRKPVPPTASSPPQPLVPTEVIQDLLHLQDCLSAMIQSLPGGTELISLKNVWEEVVNADVTPCLAESLAKFLDGVLRSNKKIDEFQRRAPDIWLKRIIAGLFVPLQAKDVFEAFYKRDLAKRLLWNSVVSMDIEKQVCSLLKAECGTGYTSKMEGMFQDVDSSRETMMVYKQSQLGSASSSWVSSSPTPDTKVEVEVQVLTTGYWPVYPQYPNLILPDSLKEHQDRFTEHYKSKYQGRRMTWQYSLGHCVVRANGFTRPLELVVSLCQALVLTKFESSQSKWTLPALMQAIGMEDREEMEGILQSLSAGREGTRILRKIDYDLEPGKKKKVRRTIDDRDHFIIFDSFTSNKRRIRITNILQKETKEEREKTVETISRDRLYLIDAVLVRIMKARKTILHQALIPQVLEQVKVPAQLADVKMRIESLIEREYMERDAKDRNRYNYLA